MNTTDEAGYVLSILNYILKETNQEDITPFNYKLGGIFGLSESIETSLLKKIQDEGLIIIKKIKPSGSVTFTQQEDTTLDPLLRNYTNTSTTINMPGIVEIELKRKNLIAGAEHYKRLIDNNGRLLTKNKNGDFCFDEKLITIRTKPLDKSTLHYQILDILYTKHDQEGKVSMEVMEKEYLKRNKYIIETSQEKIKKSINNAIKNLFERAKVGEGQFENKLKDGRPIIGTYLKNRMFGGWTISLA